MDYYTASYSVSRIQDTGARSQNNNRKNHKTPAPGGEGQIREKRDGR